MHLVSMTDLSDCCKTEDSAFGRRDDLNPFWGSSTSSSAFLTGVVTEVSYNLARAA